MKRLPNKQQIRLLESIERLSEAGIHQKGIVMQLEKYGGKAFSPVALHCQQTLAQGKSLTDGLAPFVSEGALLALRAADNSGHFSKGIKEAIKVVSLGEASASLMIKAFAKPALGMVGMLTASAFISHFMFELLAVQYPRARWGIVSALADGFGQFWWSSGPLLLLVATLVLIGVGVSLRRWTGAARARVDGLPVYKQYRQIQSTNLLTSIANQLSAGVGIREALDVAQSSASPYLQSHIYVMRERIRQGKTNVGLVFDTGLLLGEELDSLKLLGESTDAAITLGKSAMMHERSLTQEMVMINSVAMVTFKLMLASVMTLMLTGGLFLIFGMATSSF
ncbi:hypothetical protein AB4391_01250 [Vibrio lentus]|uniref:Type II secretion system protein GspF domain-containing protein n=1 Tax=Vibrio lentus TaxID=136468 RepID=A0A2N7KP15_9VIBR|nr:hypothetical protein [Vibrio lentus]PMM78454.1 hypothetical protein BCT49_00135 [Vibrio lentus]